MAKIWGPHGDYLGSIGDGPEFIQPGDGAIGCLAAIFAPIMILVLILNIPNIAQRWQESSQEVSRNQAIVEARQKEQEVTRKLYKQPRVTTAKPVPPNTTGVGPDNRTPSWMIELANQPDRPVLITPQQAIEAGVEYYRRRHPEWKCVTTLKELEPVPRESYTIRFKLRNPKTKEGRGYVSTFEIVAQQNSSLGFLKYMSDGAIESPRE